MGLHSRPGPGYSGKAANPGGGMAGVLPNNKNPEQENQKW